jgi:hypothetical protein
VNLFGHAVVARMHRQDPGFVLGAMLPDLASIARVKLPPSRDAAIRAGVELHHATDRRFHHADAFVALCKTGLAELERAGVARPAARAVAHVGVELLLDGTLIHDREAVAAFRDALATTNDTLGDTLAHPTTTQRMAEVAAALHGADLPDAYEDVDRVSLRLERILARRPRLALAAHEPPLVRAWLAEIQPEIRMVAPGLVRVARG